MVEDAAISCAAVSVAARVAQFISGPVADDNSADIAGKLAMSDEVAGIDVSENLEFLEARVAALLEIHPRDRSSEEGIELPARQRRLDELRKAAIPDFAKDEENVAAALFISAA